MNIFETIMSADWIGLLTWIGSAAGVTFLIQLSRLFRLPERIPASMRPLIGPTVGFAAGVVSWATGASVDFGPLQGALLGTTAGTIFAVGQGAGKLKGTGAGK